METKEIIENNKLIALFMGMKVIDDGITKHFYYKMPKFQNGRLSNREGVETVTPINNLYNTSWDWLMPVVKKLDEIVWDLGARDDEEGHAYKLQDALIALDIDELYLAVVDTIKWVNHQNSLSHIEFDENGDNVIA